MEKVSLEPPFCGLARGQVYEAWKSDRWKYDWTKLPYELVPYDLSPFDISEVARDVVVESFSWQRKLQRRMERQLGRG